METYIDPRNIETQGSTHTETQRQRDRERYIETYTQRHMYTDTHMAR